MDSKDTKKPEQVKEELKEKLQKAIEELDANDMSTLESISGGLADIQVCRSGCFKAAV